MITTTRFSIVDRLPVQSCPQPYPVEKSVFEAIAINCPDKKYPQLLALWIEGRNDMGEAMIDWAKHEQIPFKCPVCGGEQVRDWWHWGAAGKLYFCTGECFCAAPPLRNDLCVEIT